MRRVNGFPGYWIDRKGRVFHRKGNVGKRLRPIYVKGRPRVNLFRDGKRCPRYVGRLVCEIYHGKAPGTMVATPRNGLPHDTRVSNMRWETRGRVAWDRSEKMNLELANRIRQEMMRSGVPPPFVAEKLGISRSHAWRIAKSKRWATGFRRNVTKGTKKARARWYLERRLQRRDEEESEAEHDHPTTPSSRQPGAPE